MIAAPLQMIFRSMATGMIPLAISERLPKNGKVACLFRYILEEAESPIDSIVAEHLFALEASMGQLDEQWLIG